MNSGDDAGPDFTERRLDGELIHDGGFIRLEKDRVRLPGGAEASRYVVRHCGAVAIIPVFANFDVLLVRQYRYTLGVHVLEVPAGKLEAGEEPLACAKRELLEETGYAAARWEKWLDTHSSVGFTDEKLEVFFARELSRESSGGGDADENVQAVRLALDEALQMFAQGRITENRTQLALLRLQLERAGLS